MAKLISATWPTARKDHICDECLCRIPRGTDYTRQFCADGREAWTWIAHTDCLELTQKIHSINGAYDDEVARLCDHDFSEVEVWRGHYPHVICRIELRRELATLRRART